MKTILITLFSAFVLLSSCTKKSGKPIADVISTAGVETVGPYFTKDNKGNAVLCWTEKDSKDSLYRLKYAVYNEQANKFNAPVTVMTSAGCSNSAESMGKIGFKADGTVLAVFAKRFTGEKNPYAGAIFYSRSADEGKNWTDAQFLHSDTVHTYGRSFFDIATLKDGELAAVWLDGRFGKQIKGSALFFARTEQGKGFGQDTCLEKGTCECCRTAIHRDHAGNIHLAYRSIMLPAVLSEKQVRDMAYKVSADNGKTFSPAKTISKDNWEITGCPHSGPSIAVTKSGVHAVWFTAGGGSGLYYTSAAGIGGDFQRRNLVTASGKHPQMIALTNDQLVMVCEEPMDAKPEKPMDMDHSHGGAMKMSHAMPANPAKIVLTYLKAGKSIEVTDGTHPDNHAVITKLNKGLMVAWIREDTSGSGIYYAAIGK